MPAHVLPPPPGSWPYHRPGTALTFPRDEGWHQAHFGRASPVPGMEWVYLNGHVDALDGSGRTFVVFAAYFTQNLRFLVIRAFDATDTLLGVWTGTAMGSLRPSRTRLDLEFRHDGGTDTWRGDAAMPFRSTLHATDDAKKFQMDLDLVPKKAPYEVGGTGHMPFGRRGDFFYYSLSRLDLSGSLWLVWPDGREEDVPVKGVGWFDHQWGDFFVTPIRNPWLEEYEWMSIQLDTEDEVMLTTVWERDGTTPSLAAYGGAGLIQRDGTLGSLVGAHRWTRRSFWESPDTGDVYSARWRFDAPEWDMHLDIVPREKDQLTPLVDESPLTARGLASRLAMGPANWLGSFWEGSCRVTGSFRGAPVKGVAFAELIKRFEAPKFRIVEERDEPNLVVLRWRVENPDEQVELRHHVFVERADGTVLQQAGDLDVPVFVLDDPLLPRGEPLTVRVRAASMDGAISSTRTIGVTL